MFMVGAISRVLVHRSAALDSGFFIDKGAFFKAHKDTPRGENMYGSLVLIYPAAHEGGTLIFRHGNKEWKFDSGEALAKAKGPSIAYAAFFSDVEHEVTLLQSGYRVTLT